MNIFFPAFVLAVIAGSCSPSRIISKNASDLLLNDPTLSKAHIGIDIRDHSGRKIFNYQNHRFFTPASNTKIFTCYAALKYLGDSIITAKYKHKGPDVYILPMGDPTVLHPDYSQQPLISFLQNIKGSIFLLNGNWKTTPFGAAWSWGNYNEYYMAERSPLPLYGNVLRWMQERSDSASKNDFEHDVVIYSLPEVNWKVNFNPDTTGKSFYVQRAKDENIFLITQGTEKIKEVRVPFITKELDAAIALLPDTTGKDVLLANDFDTLNMQVIKSVVTDSLLVRMMHESDNFLAEQILLMISQQLFGEMNEERVIHYIIDRNFSFLNEKPRWSDGSGLSRFNLFTPSMFTGILNEMHKKFGKKKMMTLFPTGGQGTLNSYFLSDSGAIYAKTGSLSGVIALSGYLDTRKGKEITFSILINNLVGDPSAVRQKMEEFLKNIRDRF